MQGDINPSQMVLVSMFADSLPQLTSSFERHFLGLASPCLVYMMIDVAVVTVQVATRRDLANELPHRCPLNVFWIVG